MSNETSVLSTLSMPSAAEDCARSVNESWAARQPRTQPESSPGGEPRVMRVDYGTELYKSTLELRERILRAPLGLSLWHENLTLERDQEHFAVIDCTGLVLACLIVVPISPIKVKLRQMAVTEGMQGQGLGSSLMRHVEAQLHARGVRHIELHARHTALGFYQRLGYIAEGEAFNEVTLPHRKMVRNLS